MSKRSKKVSVSYYQNKNKNVHVNSAANALIVVKQYNLLRYCSCLLHLDILALEVMQFLSQNNSVLLKARDKIQLYISVVVRVYEPCINGVVKINSSYSLTFCAKSVVRNFIYYKDFDMFDMFQRNNFVINFQTTGD